VSAVARYPVGPGFQSMLSLGVKNIFFAFCHKTLRLHTFQRDLYTLFELHT